MPGDVAVEGFESVALKEHGVFKASGIGCVDPKGSARRNPQARTAVKVHAGSGANVKGCRAVDHGVAIDHVGLVWPPYFVGPQHYIGNQKVRKGWLLPYGKDSIGVVKVRVPGQSHEVNVL